MNAFMSESAKWSAPPQSLSLESGEVHVWRVDLERPEAVLEKFWSTLEPYEIERANRFHFEKHRRGFVVGRGFLREVVSRYLKSEAASLRFSYGAFGKPALDGDSRLQFNMSHSHEVALLAITEGREVGVDVEHVRTDFASDEIARRFFSVCEVDVFNALATEDQVAAFFRCWTRKEAYIKAIGRGLSQALDAFDVTLAPGEPPALLRASESDPARWTMRDLEVGEEYAAALMVEGEISTLDCWHFSA